MKRGEKIMGMIVPKMKSNRTETETENTKNKF